jgi:AmpE protein
MHFLIVLIAVVALESSGQLAFIQRDLWLRKWYAALSRISALNQNSMFKTLLFVLVPAAAVQLVIWSLADGVLVVLLELAVLLYSFGRGDLRKQIDTLESDIERSDLQAAFHDAAVFNIGHRGSSVEDAAGLFHELTATLPYRLFERTFAAVFWFFFLGAPVALAYRLLALHGEMQLDGDNAEAAAKQTGQSDGLIADDIANLEFHADSDKRADEAIDAVVDGVVDGVVEESSDKTAYQSANQLLWYLEWLPARALALTLGLMGDFSRATGELNQVLFCTQTSTADLLRRCVLGALNTPHNSQAETPETDPQAHSDTAALQQVAEVVALFRRSMTGWLVLIALAVLMS